MTAALLLPPLTASMAQAPPASPLKLRQQQMRLLHIQRVARWGSPGICVKLLRHSTVLIPHYSFWLSSTLAGLQACCKTQQKYHLGDED